MKLAGRPIRFLGLVLGGWTALRVAVLLPEAIALPEAVRINPDLRGFSIASFAPPLDEAWPEAAAVPRGDIVRAALASTGGASSQPGGRPVAFALLARIGFGEPQRRPRPTPGPTIAAPYPPPRAPGADVAARRDDPRLSGSAWLALRGDGAGTLGPGGQLGGSQAGARLRYELGQSRRFALSARVSAPTRGVGREAAIGLEWRPTDLPVALIAEQRIALDGGGDGQAVMAIGGLNPTAIGGGFRLEGYAQGGGVLRGGVVEPFIDGAARIARPLARIGASDVTLGVGAWGGAQRGAQRMDIGPSIAVALPLGQRSARVSLDWRERVAGGARPGSGLALTLGGDF